MQAREGKEEGEVEGREEKERAGGRPRQGGQEALPGPGRDSHEGGARLEIKPFTQDTLGEHRSCRGHAQSSLHK